MRIVEKYCVVDKNGMIQVMSSYGSSFGSYGLSVTDYRWKYVPQVFNTAMEAQIASQLKAFNNINSMTAKVKLYEVEYTRVRKGVIERQTVWLSKKSDAKRIDEQSKNATEKAQKYWKRRCEYAKASIEYHEKLTTKAKESLVVFETKVKEFDIDKEVKDLLA